MVKTASIAVFLVLIQYRSVTDRHTDGRTDGFAVRIFAERCKNQHREQAKYFEQQMSFVGFLELGVFRTPSTPLATDLSVSHFDNLSSTSFLTRLPVCRGQQSLHCSLQGVQNAAAQLVLRHIGHITTLVGIDGAASSSNSCF